MISEYFKIIVIFFISDFRRDFNIVIFFWVFPRRQIAVGQLQFDAGEIPRRKYTIVIFVCN